MPLAAAVLSTFVVLLVASYFFLEFMGAEPKGLEPEGSLFVLTI